VTPQERTALPAAGPGATLPADWPFTAAAPGPHYLGDPVDPSEVPSPGAALRLRVVSGADAGAILPLGAEPVLLGRARENHLCLADRKVSRRHVRIERLDDVCVATDLGSRNGTRLNGVPILRAGFLPGDFLYLGDTVVAMELVGRS